MSQRNRFKDASWFNKAKETTVFVGGAGGIGSWLAFLLLRAGFRVVVYDDDIVEEHNLGGQLFQIDDIGKPKVDALRNVVESFNFNEGSFTTRNEKILETTNFPTYGYSNIIYASCFDNMKAREVFLNHYIKKQEDRYYKPSLFIDGRLLMEQMTIFNVTDKDSQVKYFQEHIFDDSEVDDLPCSMKQTTHSATMIASHMVGFITNHCANQAFEEKLFAVPFKWEYLIPLNYIA